MPNNYTVTSTAIQAAVGAQVNLTTPTVTLTISANTGYTVAHTDFVVGDALPSEIASAVFSQNGLVVECLLTLSASFIMPASDVNLPIDIDGAAVLKQYSISGLYDINTSNTNQTTSTGTAYNATGDFGETVTLFSLTFTADANYAFESDPQYIVALANSFPGNYSITRVDTTGSLGLTQVVYTVKYTLTADNTTGDLLEFTANAAEQYVAGPTVYRSYILQDIPSRDIFNEYFISSDIQSYTLRIFGDVGANVTIDMDTGGLPTNLYTAETITSALGYIDLIINFPGVVIDTDYNITLSGDIVAGFAQPNPIVVHAVVGTVVTLAADALTGYTIVRTGTYTKTAPEGYTDLTRSLDGLLLCTFSITKDDGSLIKFKRIPNWSDFRNLDPLLNGGTEILHALNLLVTGDGTTEVKITAKGTIVKFGSTDVTCFLSLENVLNLIATAVDDSATVNKGESVLIDVLANDSDPEGDGLTPVIITQPSYGTATIESNKVRYTHNNSSNYVDSFTYSANDGYINSNIAKVNVGIGVAPGESLSLSSTEGIFYIPVVVGTAGGTFTIHFDSVGVPDRVEMVYKGNIVADSLFIGDNLIGAGRAAAIADIVATTSLDSFDYVGSNGDGTYYGKSAEWNLKVASNPLVYADPADIAPTGNTRTDPTSNFGGQVGVGNLVYTSSVDVVGVTGLDSADGNASVSFVVPPGDAAVVTLKITGIQSTGWSIYQTSMV